MKEKGYITFVRENKDNNIFLRKYTYNKEVKVGDEISQLDNVIICDKVYDTLRYMTSEDWDNLIFLNVIINPHQYIDSDYYDNKMPIAKDIKVIDILSKNDVFNLIKKSVPYKEYFSKYIKGIKLSEDEINILINEILGKINTGINNYLAPIAYYQYEDKDAFKKAIEEVYKPIIKIQKNK